MGCSECLTKILAGREGPAGWRGAPQSANVQMSEAGAHRLLHFALSVPKRFRDDVSHRLESQCLPLFQRHLGIRKTPRISNVQRILSTGFSLRCLHVPPATHPHIQSLLSEVTRQMSALPPILTSLYRANGCIRLLPRLICLTARLKILFSLSVSRASFR